MTELIDFFLIKKQLRVTKQMKDPEYMWLQTALDLKNPTWKHILQSLTKTLNQKKGVAVIQFLWYVAAIRYAHVILNNPAVV